MGFLFSKRKDEGKTSELKKVKTRFWKKTPRNAASAQSLNTDNGGATFSPNPNADYQPEYTQSLTNIHSPELPPRSSVQQQNVRHWEDSIKMRSKTKDSAITFTPRSRTRAPQLANLRTNSLPEVAQRPEVQTHSHGQTLTKLLPVNVLHTENSINTQSKTKDNASMSTPPRSRDGASHLPNLQIDNQPGDSQSSKMQTHSHDQTLTKLLTMNALHTENSINTLPKTKDSAIILNHMSTPPRSSERPSALPKPNIYSQPEDTRSPRTRVSLILDRLQANSNTTQHQSKVYGSIDPPLRSAPTPGPNKGTANQRKTVPDSEQVVRASRNYKSDTLKKGDRKGDENFYAQTTVTREVGLVTTNSESKIASNDVESQKCFFKGMDREAAEAKLLDPDLEAGTYLLRPSEGDYALSLRCESEFYDLDLMHYKVRVTDKGICYIDADSNIKPFGKIVELIKHYKENSGLRCKLKKPLLYDDPLIFLDVKSSDLELGEKLGSGNFAIVYAGTLHGNRQVAVKSLKNGGSMTVDEFRKEAETMHKLRHPNLVSLLGISEDSGKIIIIMEMMSKGALVNLLREDDDHAIRFKDIMDMAIQVGLSVFYCIQVSEGMCFLETMGFVHRDLRAANVLVGEGNVAKIADFGLTRLLDNYYEHEDYYQDKKGSVFPYKWTAPEAIKKQKFTVKTDVWSFGILLYEMVTHGEEPYAAMSNRESLAWVEEGNRLERPRDYHCPLALYNIMKQCWMKNSDERPNFQYIKENLVEIKTNA